MMLFVRTTRGHGGPYSANIENNNYSSPPSVKIESLPDPPVESFRSLMSRPSKDVPTLLTEAILGYIATSSSSQASIWSAGVYIVLRAMLCVCVGVQGCT